ncbi:regulatory protein RecX [Microbacterium sp. Leaf320]|uniref:regulatory protein RecX n=1 Tax=Microbacterium sp. Leaf320 TaxID=1736334 RepID=UPI0006FE30BF|nr:regulatory protein RecX [Microbacterium sp. Leaf320]KQQ69002.1 hypothetical protein ASF63_03245 [Microbacterium sp. Leaf320]
MSDDGGEQDQLAPVIPLFGRNASREAPTVSGSSEMSERTAPGSPDGDPSERHRFSGDEVMSSARPGEDGPDRADGVPAWNSTWGQADPKATVTPVAAIDSRDPSERHPARGAATRSAPRLRALQPQSDPDGDVGGADPIRVREAAEELLVRKLRSRSLSISEARMVLKGYEQDGARLDSGAVDDVLDDFCRRGYLDDALLAGQLVTSGVERKGQGRVALSRALAQRGIPRDVVDAALDELPDDDAERALEYARTKARGLSRLDGDTALRRLVGQLSRRGYNGSVAMTAAKTALAEASFGRSTSGVRFVDSD